MIMGGKILKKWKIVINKKIVFLVFNEVFVFIILFMCFDCVSFMLFVYMVLRFGGLKKLIGWVVVGLYMYFIG